MLRPFELLPLEDTPGGYKVRNTGEPIPLRNIPSLAEGPDLIERSAMPHLRSLDAILARGARDSFAAADGKHPGRDYARPIEEPDPRDTPEAIQRRLRRSRVMVFAIQIPCPEHDAPSSVPCWGTRGGPVQGVCMSRVTRGLAARASTSVLNKPRKPEYSRRAGTETVMGDRARHRHENRGRR